MAKKADEMITIVVPMESLSPDPVQYKPYAPRFDLSGIGVEVQIPKRLYRYFDKKRKIDVYHMDAVPIIAHQLSLSIAQNYHPVLATNR